MLKMRKYAFLFVIFLAIYCISAVFNSFDYDLGARLAVGSIFAHTGSVLKHDIFAYTPTKELWVDHEWGAGVVFYYLTHFLGDYGLVLFKFFTLFFIFILVFNCNQLRIKEDENPYRITYYLIMLYGLLFAFDNTIRALSFTYVFFALWIYMLDLVRLGNNRLIWIFPVTMIIWANAHGGFPAGLGLVLLYAVGEAISRRKFLNYVYILILSTLATLINPYGIKYWTFIVDAVTMSRPFVREWDPIDLLGPIGIVPGFKIMLVMTVLALVYMLARSFREINWTEVLVLAVTCYLSIKHIRHNVFFVIASGAYIYNYFYPALNWYTFGLRDKIGSIFPDKLRNVGSISKDVMVYGILLLVGYTTAILHPPKVNLDEYKFPVKAVKFIEENKLSGNLLVLYNWGSYVLWKLYPQCLIAVDGRYEEVYPNDFIGDVARFHYVGKNWDGLLTKYHSDVLLIPKHYDIYPQILKLRDWKLVYSDEIAGVFVPVNKARKNWKPVPEGFDWNKEKYITNIKF